MAMSGSMAVGNLPEVANPKSRNAKVVIKTAMGLLMRNLTIVLLFG